MQPQENALQLLLSTHADDPEDEDDELLLVLLLLDEGALSPPPAWPVQGPWLKVAQALSQCAFGP